MSAFAWQEFGPMAIIGAVLAPSAALVDPMAESLKRTLDTKSTIFRRGCDEAAHFICKLQLATPAICRLYYDI
jgi:hypothetical protein